jgi:ribosome-binding protein aMBF1 (putative translation factor)
MKKHPTKATVSIVLGKTTTSYTVPAAAVPQLKVELERAESIPWREALNVKRGEEGPAALRGARVIRGMSQTALAEKLGIGQANVAHMEAGRRAIGKAMAKRLGKVLSVDYRIFL